MANRWDGVQKAAMQILGPQGKIPEIPDALDKAMEGSQKSWAEFQAASKSLKDKLDAHEQKYDIHLSALRGFADEINGDDLGLDPKKTKTT